MKLARSVRGMFALLLAAAPLVASPAQAQDASVAREVRVEVDGGYRPSRIELVAGEPVRLVFVRRDYSPCTREVVFPTLGIRRTLPTNQPVTIALPALTPGEHEFRCGMNMLRGTLVVTPRR
jgi:plastocyanin domain-containing protein